MSDAKRERYFVRNPESGEPWAYCGDFSDRMEIIQAFGYFIEAEIGKDFGGAESVFTVEVMRREMTDEEVAALPDV